MRKGCPRSVDVIIPVKITSRSKIGRNIGTNHSRETRTTKREGERDKGKTRRARTILTMLLDADELIDRAANVLIGRRTRRLDADGETRRT